jgi:phage shock protein PspC (stress-responsive transcriptional regulator)
MLAGVSSGLASYFNIDPILFRLAFVFLTIFGGSGIIIYLVLWVIIPEAKTTAQKLEMKGEPVNIENIEKKIREEFDNLNDKFHDLKDKHFKKKDGLGQSLNDIVNVFAQIILAILKFVGFALAIAFGIASIVLLMMFFIGIFPSGAVFLSNFDGINFYSVPELLEFLFSSEADARFALSSLIIVVIVPLFSILYNSMRLIFGVRKHTPNLGFAFGVVWIAGAVMFAISAFQLADEFSDSNSKEIDITENKTIGDTLFVKLSNFDYKSLNKQKSEFHFNRNDECYIIDDKIYLLPEINISTSKNDDFKIIIEKSSKGNSERKADVLLNNIEYNYNLTDSLFTFSPFFKIHKNDKWRNQDIEIYIYKPKGKHIEFLTDDNDGISSSKINRHFKWEFK